MSLLILSIIVQWHSSSTSSRRTEPDLIWVLALLSLPERFLHRGGDSSRTVSAPHGAAHRARLRKAMDPGADLRRYESEARVASTSRAASATRRNSCATNARRGHRSVPRALTGLYEMTPILMQGLAQAQFGKARQPLRGHAR